MLSQLSVVGSSIEQKFYMLASHAHIPAFHIAQLIAPLSASSAPSALGSSLAAESGVKEISKKYDTMNTSYIKTIIYYVIIEKFNEEQFLGELFCCRRTQVFFNYICFFIIRKL